MTMRQGGRRSTREAAASSVGRAACHQVVKLPNATSAAVRASQRATIAQPSTDGDDDAVAPVGGACAPVGSTTNANRPCVAWPSMVETTWYLTV
ncbi:MAG: hypothetical protein LC798_14295 [Chloroflexi bacterium]|nr:hypothetical protein [Chloroflexota bacterium]